jgi:hypothetical protein
MTIGAISLSPGIAPARRFFSRHRFPEDAKTPTPRQKDFGQADSQPVHLTSKTNVFFRLLKP